MPFTLLSIEGNIGSGKSTLIDHLKHHYQGDTRIVFAPEPVSEWEKIKDKEGVTMLQKFYMDQDKYAFSFQMMAYMSRVSMFRKLVKEAGDKHVVIITERSLCTDKYVFAKMLYDQGKIEEVNYQIYSTWFDEFYNDFPVNHVIYIKANPDTCFERIQRRSRTGEDVLALDYLTQCHTYHNEYIAKFTSVTTLDGNQDIYQRPDVLHEWIQYVSTLITDIPHH